MRTECGHAHFSKSEMTANKLILLVPRGGPLHLRYINSYAAVGLSNLPLSPNIYLTRCPTSILTPALESKSGRTFNETKAHSETTAPNRSRSITALAPDSECPARFCFLSDDPEPTSFATVNFRAARPRGP